MIAKIGSTSAVAKPGAVFLKPLKEIKTKPEPVVFVVVRAPDLEPGVTATIPPLAGVVEGRYTSDEKGLMWVPKRYGNTHAVALLDLFKAMERKPKEPPPSALRPPARKRSITLED